MIENPYDIFDIFILGLAVWRLSYMLTSEDGNMSIAYLVRLIGMRPKNKEKSRWSAWKQSLTKPAAMTPMEISNNFGKMLTCIWCTSSFVGFVWVAVYINYGGFWLYQYFTLGMAIGAIAVIINDFKFSQ